MTRPVRGVESAAHHSGYNYCGTVGMRLTTPPAARHGGGERGGVGEVTLPHSVYYTCLVALIESWAVFTWGRPPIYHLGGPPGTFLRAI